MNLFCVISRLFINSVEFIFYRVRHPYY